MPHHSPPAPATEIRAGLVVNALGCAVQIETQGLSPEADAETRRVWAGAVASPGDPLPVCHLTMPVPGGPLDGALSTLSQRVTRAAIEARRGQLWMLHAAGISDADGRVIALIGPSGQGKTTAARVLSTHYGYVSDETVGIGEDGCVLPYRKPLSVIEGSVHVKVQRSPEELGLLPLPPVPLRLAALVLLDRRPDGPAEPALERCDLGEVLLELVAQTSHIGELPAPLRTIAAHASSVGGILRVVYREADTLHAALAPLFREPHSTLPDEPAGRARRVPEGPGLYRRTYLDALPLDQAGQMALLQPEPDGGSILRLVAGIGPALWEAADGSSLAELVSAAKDAYGAPEGIDVHAAVESAVAELTRQCVLTTEPSWRVRTDVAFTGQGTHFVALPLENLQNAAPLALEGTAATIWDALSSARGLPVSDLIDQVARRAGVGTEVVSASVVSFLDSLEESSLAERIAP